MSDKTLSGPALAAAGLAAAGLMAARTARAATPTNHVTFYFTTPPATTGANVVQIPSTATNFTTASPDVQILNFALAVETIEAERYRQTIARLTSGGTDAFGNPIAGLGLSTASLDVLLVTGFAQTEMQQRDVLATTLYGSPTANPFLDTTQYLFDFGINSLDRTGAVTGIYTAETIGVSAYLGGSGLLSIKSPFLAPAASFLGVEARHAAGLGVCPERAERPGDPDRPAGDRQEHDRHQRRGSAADGRPGAVSGRPGRGGFAARHGGRNAAPIRPERVRVPAFVTTD